MLVSAISAGQSQTLRATSKNNKSNSSSFSFNSVENSTKKSTKKLDNKMFESINEWKDFCNKQVAAGKLDIIA